MSILKVSADKYFAVVSKVDTVLPQSKKIRVDCTSNEPKNCQNETMPIPNDDIIDPMKTGRRKGSKTIGLSKLRQLNPNISMADTVIGTPCSYFIFS